MSISLDSLGSNTSADGLEFGPKMPVRSALAGGETKVGGLVWSGFSKIETL